MIILGGQGHINKVVVVVWFYLGSSTFKYMCNLQENSSKLRNIKYHMDYIHSQEEASHVFSLRTRTVRGIRSDFLGMYATISCPLDSKCESIDTLSHVLECQIIASNLKTHIVSKHVSTLSDIYSDNIVKQKEVTTLFKVLLDTREKIMSGSLAPNTARLMLCS